jgi:hypothetical protein
VSQLELSSVILRGQLKPSEGTVTASFADQEIWHVLVASDDMKRMNVDQLDDAFRLDIVDASTLVWKAGMRTWQRLGSLAGIEEDEPETITKQMTPETLAQLMPLRPPPPPPPLRPRSLAPTPPPPRPAPVPAFKTQQFAAPLVATPMYVPQLHAPDPYVLPKRRANLPSEVDFRRRSGGVRLGRWLIGLLLVTTGVLVCYRQNLLREGARRIGIENKYLYGEKRVLSFVTATAPSSVQNALKRLALLPGPNATPAVMTASSPPPSLTPRAPQPSVAPAIETAKAASSADSDVKTVSLDSLPVLGAEPAAAKVEAKLAAPAPKTVAPRAAAVASKPAVKAEPRAKKVQLDEEDEPAPKPKAKKAEPKPEPEPEPKVAKQAPPPPPSGNESFLKAAIRSAIAADQGK